MPARYSKLTVLHTPERGGGRSLEKGSPPRVGLDQSGELGDELPAVVGVDHPLRRPPAQVVVHVRQVPPPWPGTRRDPSDSNPRIKKVNNLINHTS